MNEDKRLDICEKIAFNGTDSEGIKASQADVVLRKGRTIKGYREERAINVTSMFYVSQIALSAIIHLFIYYLI